MVFFRYHVRDISKNRVYNVMKKANLLVLLLGSAFLASTAFAQAIYNCGGTFTNKPTKGCSRMKLKDNISIIGSDTPVYYSGGGGSSKPSGGASKPRAAGVQNTSRTYPTETVAENTTRNQGRLGILQTELAGETTALSKAQAALNAGKNSPNRQNLQNTVVDHQKNIEAIQKEIARTK